MNPTHENKLGNHVMAFSMWPNGIFYGLFYVVKFVTLLLAALRVTARKLGYYVLDIFS